MRGEDIVNIGSGRLLDICGACAGVCGYVRRLWWVFRFVGLADQDRGDPDAAAPVLAALGAQAQAGDLRFGAGQDRKSVV